MFVCFFAAQYFGILFLRELATMIYFSFERHFGNTTTKGMSKKNDHKKKNKKRIMVTTIHPIPYYFITIFLSLTLLMKEMYHSIQKKVGITIKSLRLA